MGVYFLSSELADVARIIGVSTTNVNGQTIIHEWMHLVIDPADNATWDGEHLIGNPGGTALMGDATVKTNNQESTVDIKNATQNEMDVAGNPTLH